MRPAAFALMLSFAAVPASAQDWTRNKVDPVAVSRVIEARAGRSSFQQLDAFAEAAMQLRGRERLNRLYYAAWIFLNQSEFAKFERYNGALLALAAREHDHRYEQIARLNQYQRAFDEGDTTKGDGLKRAAANEPDWFARVHALRLVAYALAKEGQVARALKVLDQAEAQVPADDSDAPMARAGVAEMAAIAYLQLGDLTGTAASLAKSEAQFDDPAYPRPDFDGLYNMAVMATRLGQSRVAGQLYQAHHRLASRSDLPALKVWDAQLCAAVADQRNDPRGVLACLERFDEALTRAEFLAPKILTLRALARARTGDASGAGRDLARLRGLRDHGDFGAEAFARTPEIEAELLGAEGRHEAAFATLRAHSTAQSDQAARQFSEAMKQATGDMESQLATAKRNVQLQARLISSQRYVTVVSIGGLLVFLLLLARQWRVSRQLREARRRADVANRAKSEFLANMSHEIRTPLNGIVAVAGMLADAKLPPREREMVALVQSSAAALEGLLTDIIDLAKVEAGKIQLERAPFRLEELIESVAALGRVRAEQKQVAVLTVVEADAMGMVLGDALRLRQVLTNLVSNAVKFTEAGTVTIRAEHLTGDRHRISVQDTGVGFDAAAREAIFGRFQQADGSITRRFGGSGLGLAICRELMQLMDGEIDCESTPGQGAIFRIELPLPPHEAAPAATAAEGETMAPPDGLRVLVADDHPVNRRVVELALSGMAEELVSVEDGAQAVEEAARGEFDLILMDMQMPVMDGVTAIREIRALEQAGGRRPTPIIMLTANALAEHVEAALAAGADWHLAKPFTPAGLYAAVGAVLRDEPEDAEELAA